MKEHRLLVTGTRGRTDVDAVRHEVAAYRRDVQPATVTLVHAAPSGDLVADFALAFVDQCTDHRCAQPDPHASHEAANCAELAITANIPTKVIRVGW